MGETYLDCPCDHEANTSVGDRTRGDSVQFNPLILRPTQEFVVVFHDIVWRGEVVGDEMAEIKWLLELYVCQGRCGPRRVRKCSQQLERKNKKERGQEAERVVTMPGRHLLAVEGLWCDYI